MSELITDYHFPVCIHRVMNTDFIKDMLPLHDEYVEKARASHPLSSLYPMTMTEPFTPNEKAAPFVDFVKAKAEQAIMIQGYDLDYFDVFVRDVFGQQHQYSSSMEPHFHNTFLTGFYFLEVPSEEIKAYFQDPKDIKTFNNLKEKDYSIISPATSDVNYNPEPGLLMLTNGWLKHSFSRNPSSSPFKFIHIGIAVHYNPNKINSKKLPVII